MKLRRRRNVAVTGIGMVTPLGHDRDSTWAALMAGRSGLAEIRSFDASGFPARIAAEVKGFDPRRACDTRSLRFAARFTPFALAAAEEAFVDAGIRPLPAVAERWGLVTGTGMMTSEVDFLHRVQKTYAPTGVFDTAEMGRDGTRVFSAVEFAQQQMNSTLAHLLRRYGIMGYTASVHTACASGGQALGLAMKAIRRGDADFVLAGGFDSMINPMGLGSFCLLGALSTDNETPERASRPFDLTRAGFVLGEGAAFLVLEEWRHARDRGARIYAELAGEGNTLSSYRITDSHPSGDGAIQALRMCLGDAKESIETVDYINAHGTSTKMNDISETNAIKAIFGPRAPEIPTSSTKSQMGHLIAAAGAVEGAICALAIQRSTIPMTANRRVPDPECDLDYVVEGPREKPLRTVISNSFGFGGSNSCILFRSPAHAEARMGHA